MAATYGGTGALSGNSYGDLSKNDAFFFQKKMLPVAKKTLTFQRLGQKETKPQNQGLEVRWRRYEKFPLALNPIAEGVTPDFDQLSHTTVLTTLKQYGSWVPTTDVLAASSTDPVLNEIVEKQAIQAAETIDFLTFQAVRAGTQVGYARSTGSTGRSDCNRTISMITGILDGTSGATDQLTDMATRVLEGNDANKLTKIIKASADYNTEPVSEAYFAVAHTDLRADIKTLPGFVPVEKYSNMGSVLPGEIGKVGLLRFILTTQATAWAGTGASTAGGEKLTSTSSKYDVYPVIIVGKDSFGSVSLSGKDAIRSKVVMPKPGPTDPIGQRGSVAWDTFYSAAILQDLWLYRLEVCCSTLSS